MRAVTGFFRIALCCAMIALSGGANADTWPSRPIKLIVPTGPGAATDVMARLVADGVSRTLGQAMFVENVPGASGILAHENAARAAPDGYTLLFTNTSGMAINLISFKQLPYDPTRDFTAVAVVCNLAPQMLSVNEALPVTTVAELIAYAKANPGKLSIAFDNTAGAAAFGAKLFNKRAGLELVEVPYRSGAQMVQDVAGGINQVMMSSIAAANAVVQSGKVRRLAVTSDVRWPASGRTRFGDAARDGSRRADRVMNGFFAIVAPAGTLAEIVAWLNCEIGQLCARAAPKSETGCWPSASPSPAAARLESSAAAIRMRSRRAAARASGVPNLNVEPQ